MRNIFTSAIVSVLIALNAAAAPVAHYINFAPLQFVTPPQIDAISFENRSLFDINNFDNRFPYETFDTLHFTNTASGTMSASQGFLFDHSFSGGRTPLTDWVNRGLIAGQLGVTVRATNLINAGRGLGAGSLGVLHLEGNNVNLSRSTLYSGPQYDSGFSTFFFSSTNFVFSAYPPDRTGFANGRAIDNYWGVGSNTLNGALIASQFTVPSPQSPTHTVTNLGGNFVNLLGGFRGFFGGTFVSPVSLPDNFAHSGSYGALVYTNSVTNTTVAIITNVIQVVFFPTNDVSVDVRFFPNRGTDGLDVGSGNGNIVGVRMGIPDYDAVLGTTVTNYFYVEDYLAFQTTNLFVARNFSSSAGANASTYRPNTYYFGLTPSGRINMDSPSAATANFNYDPGLLYNSSHLSNNLTLTYAGYSTALLLGQNVLGSGPLSSRVGAPGWSGLPINDITNFTGRIEIQAKKLNLDNVRIRGESAVMIKAEDLTGNKLPLIDAPILSFDLKSTQTSLVVSNIAPTTSNRLIGNISAYSAIWMNGFTNDTTTNVFQIHVLMLDHSLTLTQQVVVQDLSLRSTNVVISDTVRVGRQFVSEGRDFTVNSSGFLIRESGDIGSTNLINVYNLTNEGTIFVARQLKLGSDRPKPYSNIVNYASIIAGGMDLKSDQIINSNVFQSDNGSASFFARKMYLSGDASTVLAYGDVVLGGANLVATNSLIFAGTNSLRSYDTNAAGHLTIAFTNSVSDGDATNFWCANQGFSIGAIAMTGDLLSTTIYSKAADFTEVIHSSAAKNWGVDPKGYQNNMAIGHLVLDGGTASLFRFSPPAGSTNAALYVDYLELLNYATNYQDAIVVDEGFTLYFANSNISPKRELNHASDDRLRWVSTFAGKYSTTNIVYSGSANYDINSALVLLSDVDSDNDGVANVNDATPVWESVNTDLQCIVTNIAKRKGVLLTGNALVTYNDGVRTNYATNILEYTLDLNSGNWKVLTNIITPTVTVVPPQSIPFSYFDQGLTNKSRHYRVRVRVLDP